MRPFIIAAVAVTLATGCGTTTASFVGETRELPPTAAGKPTHVNLPAAALQAPPILIGPRASALGVRLLSKGHWHGKRVTIYYVPARNIRHRGDHYDIVRTDGLQRVATAGVRRDGTWEATWWTGSYRIAPHHQVFLLAVSDLQEIRLILVNTLN